MILPMIFIGFVVFYKGTLEFNFKDIIMPFFVPVILAFIYDGGKNSKKRIRENER